MKSRKSHNTIYMSYHMERINDMRALCDKYNLTYHIRQDIGTMGRPLYKLYIDTKNKKMFKALVNSDFINNRGR